MTDLQTLEKRIALLEDINAIKELKARYLRGCDLQRPEEVRDCLSPDGAVIAYEGFPPFHDRDSFVEIFRTMGCVAGIYDIHHGANPVITITGEDSATGKWSLYFQNINLAHRTVTQMGVEYDDDYVRRDGRWWISRTATKRTSCIVQQVDEDGKSTIVALGEAPAAFGEAPAQPVDA
ncbi:nuclear transport factor 2 family protein [Sphingobium sp. WCS2017Hpa-17]|uniref:nuclear transport factor 2 family protein n=1 Tax=Sphingobium sp. WCS2017Hpa-17 TaxID=3073638 RepID=UPI00288BE0BB|nr:nuclear transport factor 2 family protein [Sphingobium sp. WCS2017Hpa-17]